MTYNSTISFVFFVSFARSLAGSKQQHEAGPQLVFGWWCLMWSFNFLSSVKPSVVWNRLGQVTLCPGCICIQRLQDAIGSWQIENQRFSLLMVLSWQFLPCVSSRPQSWRLTNFRGAASHWSTFLGISRTWTRRVVLSTRSPTVLIRWDLLFSWRPMLRSGPRILLHVSRCKWLRWLATLLLLGPGESDVTQDKNRTGRKKCLSFSGISSKCSWFQNICVKWNIL